MTDLFVEKNETFEDLTVKEMISNIIKNMKNNKNVIHLECIVEFVKTVFEVKYYDNGILVSEIFDGLDSKFEINEVGDVGVFANVLQILALSKPMFDEVMAKNVITKNDSVLVSRMSRILEFTNDIEVISKILKFLNEYAVTLVGVHKEKTIHCLCKLIENIPPHSVSILKNDLSVCLYTYKNKTDISQEIEHSFHKWCEHFNMVVLNEDLNEKLSDPCPTTDEDFADKIHSLATMCQIFGLPIETTETWTGMLLQNDDKLKFAVVSDLLSVSAKCLDSSEFEDILRNNEHFVIKYLRVYFERIVKSEMDLSCSFFVYLLNYFINNYKSYKQYHGEMMELIQKNWPCFDEASFEDKLAIASDILKLPEVKADIPPVQWVIKMITQESTSLDHKLKMISLLPGGEEYSGCYRHIAGFLPTRLSDGSSSSWKVLRTLLDLLAVTGDVPLLNMIATLVADDAPGWWNEAIEACMVSLADRKDEKIFDVAYSACKRRYGLGICKRVLVPLLRHSPRAFCEKYVSKIIEELITTLKMGYKDPSNTNLYRDRVLSYTKAFAILQVVIEKLSTQSLESGILNNNGGLREPWYLVKTVCICSVTLMDKVRCPDDASDEIRQACLRLQCAAYNCLTTAICRRRPAQKQYNVVFNTTAWSKIVDPAVEYEFKIRGYQNESSSRKLSDGRSAASTSFTGTVRTRIFMTTLSENPLQYDLIPNEDDAEDIEENKSIGYANHPLNANGCLATVTTSLQHASTLDHTEWLTNVSEGLTSSLPLNAKWLLAQAICYADSDLKSHASSLTPAMLEFVATTAKISSKERILNNLHIDVLWTITKWNIPELPSYTHLSSAVQYLIHTYMEYKSSDAVSRRLLNTLSSLLQVYGSKVTIPWTVFEGYCTELPQNAFPLLTILQRVLKSKISLPQLLPVLFDKFEAKFWPSTSKLPEVFGLGLSLNMNEGHLSKFWQVLDSLKSNVSGFVKVLMYAQRVCPKCCNERMFRNIVDIASKAEKTKCLSIIAVYLENLEEDEGSCADVFETIGLKELLDAGDSVEALKVVHGGFKFMGQEMKDTFVECVGQECFSGTPAVRKEAYAVMLSVFQDLFEIKEGNMAKRPALTGTPILNTMATHSIFRYQQLVIERVSQGLFDADQDISKMIKEGVVECLSKDMDKRLAELFYLIFYYTKKDCSDLSEYGYIFLDLLFAETKQMEVFKNKKFSDRPLPPSDVDIGFTCSSGVRKQQHVYNMDEYRSIDVQMPVATIFETFLQAAKVNSQICEELCIQVIKKVAAESSGPRFNLGSAMVDILKILLDKEPNCLTPLYLEVSKVFLNDFIGTHGFEKVMTDLKGNIRNESLSYLNIVYEDFSLRKEDRCFIDFSGDADLDVEMKYEDQQFSIESLINIFGKLANWDDLRMQDKRKIEDSLPPLLVGGAEFTSSLDEYLQRTTLDYKGWFHKMVGAYNSYKLSIPLIQYKENWLKDAQRWPKSDFVTTAVIEAMHWPNNLTAQACEIRASDCLAEWAGRLMIRSAYYEDDSNQAVCRADELKWCIEAMRRHLPTLALQCIERNKSSLMEDEALSWFHEKLQARRLVALRNDDDSMLRNSLEAAVRQNNILSENNICLQKVILQLRYDLKCITRTDLDAVFNNINIKNGGLSTTDRDNLKCIYDIAMDHYSDAWDEQNEYNKEVIISNMINIIDQYLKHNLSENHNLLISILINKLSYYEGTLSEETSKKIFEKITILLPKLDSFTIAQMETISAIFPKGLRDQFQRLFGDETLGLCKKYLRLICDPQYSLLQFCDKLARIKDSNEWHQLYDKMKMTIFGSPEAEGTDYKSLNYVKKKLFAIENLNAEDKQKALEDIIAELRSKPQRSGLRLSQLSPRLTKPSVLEEQQKELQKLLAIPPSVFVVKFKEQVDVYRDSIRRPCKISVLLSTGITKKYIIKTGEPLANDASLQRAVAILPTLLKCDVRSYNVTVLSEESAIIEYLEDHERLRDLMGDRVKIPLNRLPDESLLQSPSLALEQYQALHKMIPVYTLRSSIEGRCISIQEFMNKKRVFLETLSTMTIISWLFGVGDRHLHNILWDKRNGGICSVDWATIFQYGCKEFVPARLTYNLLAVCDVKVLEARLQNILENLRKNQKIYEAYIRTSFYWKKRDFKEMAYIRGILRGSMTSYQITRDVITESSIRNRESAIKILDKVFNNVETRSTYSIEEQISHLLRHCTNHSLLAVIPRGWEPWV